MLKKNHGIMFLLLGIMLSISLANCSHNLRAYVSARTVLNNYWEQYLNVRDAMPEGERKDEFRAKFNDARDVEGDSYFAKADKALDAWESSIGTSSEKPNANQYYLLFSKVMSLLVSEGIVTIE